MPEAIDLMNNIAVLENNGSTKPNNITKAITAKITKVFIY